MMASFPSCTSRLIYGRDHVRRDKQVLFVLSDDSQQG
jgi:hypothetical protein